MLGGLRPNATGVTNNEDSLYVNIPDVLTLPHYFRMSGYATARCGKIFHLGVPTGLESMGNNLYKETTASGSPELGNPGESGFGSLNQGYLEMSNVKVVEEMVNLILAQRAYEVNSKAVQAADEMMQQSNNLHR